MRGEKRKKERRWRRKERGFINRSSGSKGRKRGIQGYMDGTKGGHPASKFYKHTKAFQLILANRR